jgi:hypothetical protein
MAINAGTGKPTISPRPMVKKPGTLLMGIE